MKTHIINESRYIGEINRDNIKGFSEIFDIVINKSMELDANSEEFEQESWLIKLNGDPHYTELEHGSYIQLGCGRFIINKE